MRGTGGQAREDSIPDHAKLRRRLVFQVLLDHFAVRGLSRNLFGETGEVESGDINLDVSKSKTEPLDIFHEMFISVDRRTFPANKALC